MTNYSFHKQHISDNGFSIVNDIYTADEVHAMLNVIQNADPSKETFRKSTEVFAIRQCLKEIPELIQLVFNAQLRSLIQDVMGDNYFVVKSIYFDKPETSNWYVAYHQDLTISVDKKIELENFGPWTTKHHQFAAQPPTELLENITTIRIHLDDTDENNGALRVVPQSHLRKIYRPETINWEVEQEVCCSVKQGGVMLMKPLTLHSSGRTTNGKKRRVIHIEFSNQELPDELQWAERLNWE